MSHPFFRRVGRWCGSLLLVAALSACVGGDNQDSAAAQHKVLASVRQSDGTVVAASGFNVGDYVVLQAPAGSSTVRLAVSPFWTGGKAQRSSPRRSCPSGL